MGDSSKQICRLCLEITPTCESEPIEENKKKMLEPLLINIDLNTLHEPVVCKPCLSSTKKYYEFMTSCQEVEQKIEHFHQMAGQGTTGRVSLEDVLKFEDCNVLGKLLDIKKECSDVDIVDENVTMCPENEEARNIKYEEIDIKVESDHGMETTDTDQSGNNGSFGKDDFSKTEEKVGEIAKKEKKYFCPKCPYSSGRSDHLKNHMRTHSDNESHQCFICPFVTDSRFSLRTHMRSHRGPTKAYGCRECPYETDHRTTYRQHILKHKDELEVEMHKCPLCTYTAKYRPAMVTHLRVQHHTEKANLVLHQSVHLNPKDILMYKCANCEYENQYKRNLVKHMIIHRDPEMVNKFKCDKCPFQSKMRLNIKRHMIIHSDIRPFRCDQCPHSSKCMRHLVLHKLGHQTDGEMHKCKLCGYQAKKNITLKAHMAKSHMDTSVSVMKCAHCPYETVVKSYLSKHMRSADHTHTGLEETVVHPCAT